MNNPERKRYDLRLHTSPVVRLLFVSIGLVSLGFGVLGIFLPVLPTTVFILIAAYCFARSSERFYAALLDNRHLGPIVSNWQENRCITRRSKVYAITLIVISFGFTGVVFLDSAVARGLVMTVGLALVAYMLSLPLCVDKLTDASPGEHRRDSSTARERRKLGLRH